MPMIDINKIRSIKALEELRTTLKDYLSNPEVPNIYLEQSEEWGKVDYESDKEDVINLLGQVELRIKLLTRVTEKQVKGVKQNKKSEPSTSLPVQPPAE